MWRILTHVPVQGEHFLVAKASLSSDTR
ncbi:hypothetical protein CEXT_454101, partial [Caerostris extrusa]